MLLSNGFTLIELIVVIVIIGILAAIVIPRLSGFQETATERAVVADAKTITTAIATIIAQDNASGSVTEEKIKELVGEGMLDAAGTSINLSGVDEPTGVITFTYTKDGVTASVTDSGAPSIS